MQLLLELTLHFVVFAGDSYFHYFTLHPYVGLPYTVRSFMIVIVAGLGNLPAVAISGMGLGVFEEFADYILGTEFRIGAVFMLLVFILVYRRFKLSKKRGVFKINGKNETKRFNFIFRVDYLRFGCTLFILCFQSSTYISLCVDCFGDDLEFTRWRDGL